LSCSEDFSNSSADPLSGCFSAASAGGSLETRSPLPLRWCFFFLWCLCAFFPVCNLLFLAFPASSLWALLCSTLSGSGAVTLTFSSSASLLRLRKMCHFLQECYNMGILKIRLTRIFSGGFSIVLTFPVEVRLLTKYRRHHFCSLPALLTLLDLEICKNNFNLR
jgi:hypothetical protein